MPYSIVRESKGVYVKWAGEISGQEFLGSVLAVNQASDFDAYHYVINDMVGCAGVDLQPDIADKALAAAIGAHESNPKFVAAFVAEKGEVFDTWAEVAKVADDYLRTAVFSDLEDARRWVESTPRKRNTPTRW